MNGETALQAPALDVAGQPQQAPAVVPVRRASRAVCTPPEGPFSYDTPGLTWEEGMYASTRFHSVTIPAERIQDFGVPSRTSVLSKVTYWCRAGPEDYSGRTPSEEPKGPGKRRSKIEHGESVKRGCQAHFTIRVLAREQEVAEIRMYQPAHVNNSGEHCHNASTARKGQSHPRSKKAKPGPDGEQAQVDMAAQPPPLMPLPLVAHPAQNAEQGSKNSNLGDAAAQQLQEAMQASQALPGLDVMQHVAHMQAFLTGASTAQLQGAYPEGLPGMTQSEAAAHTNSSQLQLPAVLQLHLPSSQPDQAGPGQSGHHQQALLQQGSLPGSGAAHPEGTAPPGEPSDLPSTSGQGQPPVNMQEQPTLKQHMLQAISDGGAMMQAICAQVPNDNDPRFIQAAHVQRKANAELVRIFCGG